MLGQGYPTVGQIVITETMIVTTETAAITEQMQAPIVAAMEATATDATRMFNHVIERTSDRSFYSR
jgi:hypothetical protein